MKFNWGKVISMFSYDFDGKTMEVVKYHPWKTDGCSVLVGDYEVEEVMYFCEDLHRSSDNIIELIIHWIAYENLGLNQQALVSGVCRALVVHK